MNKKSIIFSTFIVISLILVGCGANGNQSEGSSGDKVTLTLWHYWSGHLEEVLQSNVNDFNETQDGIEVELTFVPYNELTQQLLIGATSQDVPDIIIGGINEVQFYAKSGILENINEQVENSGLATGIYENIAAIHKIDDEFHGLPLHTNAVGLFYNKDLVDEPPVNWDELTNLATDLTEDGKYGFSASAHNSQHGTASWIPFLWSTGSGVEDLGSPEAISSLELWKNMYDESIMPKEILQKELEEVGVDFYNERVAMIIGGSWMIPALEEEAPDLNWSVAQIPKDQMHASVVGGESIAIGKGQSVDEAWQFIDFLMEPERQLEWLKATGNFPAISEVANDPYFQDDEVRKVFAEVISTSQGYGWGENHNEVNTAIYTAIQEALVGGSTSEEALKKASEIIQPLIEE
ncbi:ABC transporter substrate-binding protein [Oceanobacillus profundus]|uniref:ABC transporter substrate-binding protein n=1 Tax=Oceanobacillus profundus TaxID=372463 RepID=A0A417YBG3_9BACI|nr:ABC transporter substrate-binding protein [Oceanobacillus profundus]RHW30042.1 ABC transporter substrate-binding protein [Oceanobacillus profundus]